MKLCQEGRSYAIWFYHPDKIRASLQRYLRGVLPSPTTLSVLLCTAQHPPGLFSTHYPGRGLQAVRLSMGLSFESASRVSARHRHCRYQVVGAPVIDGHGPPGKTRIRWALLDLCLLSHASARSLLHSCCHLFNLLRNFRRKISGWEINKDEPSPIWRNIMRDIVLPYPRNGKCKRWYYKRDSSSVAELITKWDLQINNSQMVLCSMVIPSESFRLNQTVLF